MTSRVSHTSVDARNALAQSLFWGQVLGYRDNPADPNLPGHEECMIYSAEVDRLLGLGASVVADRRTEDRGWVTMADPEGNEFCVLRSELEVGDPFALGES